MAENREAKMVCLTLNSSDGNLEGCGAINKVQHGCMLCPPAGAKQLIRAMVKPCYIMLHFHIFQVFAELLSLRFIGIYNIPSNMTMENPAFCFGCFFPGETSIFLAFSIAMAVNTGNG